MLAVFMSVILAVGCVAGGTVAWLVAKTDDVVNTFTFGDINIKLDEAKVDINGNPLDENGNIVDDPAKADRITGADVDEQNQYKLVPKAEYLKDPTVTVLANSEKCWLFISVKEDIAFVAEKTSEENFATYVSYSVDTGTAEAQGWIELEGATTAEGEKVYYRIVELKETDQSFNVLKDNKVSVNENLTKEQIELLDGNPTLTFKAYAVQYSGFATALDAWKVTS